MSIMLVFGVVLCVLWEVCRLLLHLSWNECEIYAFILYLLKYPDKILQFVFINGMPPHLLTSLD